ncbi:MAG: TonB family protein [Methylophilus sp.]|nr:TonB family protein [Methylophilus sp.]
MTSIALERNSTLVHTLRVKPTVQHIALKIEANNSQISDLQNKSNVSWLGLVVVLTGHVAFVVAMAMHQTELVSITPAEPMMVSLIAPPAPEPELVPIIEPPKPEPKPVVKPKPKKIVQEIKPIETPAPVLVEATTEPTLEEPVSMPTVTETVAEVPKAPPKPEPVIEEKIEPPQFGVAYLNNPQPVYPPISRRIGEEGRVLMKVLVAKNGAAKSVEIEQTSGSERLDNAAINAVKNWRFLPARKNNQSLDAFVLVPIKFSLNG